MSRNREKKVGISAGIKPSEYGKAKTGSHVTSGEDSTCPKYNTHEYRREDARHRSGCTKRKSEIAYILNAQGTDDFVMREPRCQQVFEQDVDIEADIGGYAKTRSK